MVLWAVPFCLKDGITGYVKSKKPVIEHIAFGTGERARSPQAQREPIARRAKFDEK
jgi:hypothetical protein